MISRQRKSYTLSISPRAGIVDSLTLPGDPGNVNLVHRDEQTAFGTLIYTKRSIPPRIGPNDSPMGVDSVILQEFRAFAPVVAEGENRIVCQNPVTHHRLTYELAEDHFDLWLDADIADANQVALDLYVPFKDLRQNEPAENHFNPKTLYRSEDRSLCYVYLERAYAPNMLIVALTPSAGWRLLYTDVNPVGGLQMIARFDDNLDPTAAKGAVRFGVRVLFPKTLEEARSTIARQMGIPVVRAPILSGEVGKVLEFTVEGPVAGAELKVPDGTIQPLALRSIGPELHMGQVRLDTEGFSLVRAWNAAGAGSDMVLQASAPMLQVLARATPKITPEFGSGAESGYWATALCIARRLIGPDTRSDGMLHSQLVTMGMQGLTVAGPPLAPPPEVAKAHLAYYERGVYCSARHDGKWFHPMPIPEPHVWGAKTLAPFNLYRCGRVQEAFSFLTTYVEAARAFGNEAFYEHAVRVALATVRDHVDERGCINSWYAQNDPLPHDYTTVIAPLVDLVFLVGEMERRGDGRAAELRQAGIRVADFLVRRGLFFPTEGAAQHRRWMEDGSISCTALSLIYAYWHLERKPAYLEMAKQVLAYHENWRLDVPDARVMDSTFRYWESLWENDGEGHAINAGHPWTLWRAEAAFYLGMATGDAKTLVQSYNGYRTNLCKFMPDGTAYGSFTPDYLPRRLRWMGLAHCYPKTPDHSISFYLWARLTDTWMRTVAVIDPEQVGHAAEMAPLALGAQIMLQGDSAEVVPQSPLCDRILWLSRRVRRLRIRTDKPVEVAFAPGMTLGAFRTYTPVAGVVEMNVWWAD